MPESPETSQPSVAEIQGRLNEVARMLRESSKLDPVSRHGLAELVEEMGRALRTAQLPPAEAAEIAENTAHIAEALHHDHDRGLLGKARDRLEGTLVRAEAGAPSAVGLARQFLDMLAGFGI